MRGLLPIARPATSERFGRSSIAITGDVYSHVTPGMQAEAATRVATLVDRG